MPNKQNQFTNIIHVHIEVCIKVGSKNILYYDARSEKHQIN